jgi:hypothetical protein
MFHLNRFVTPLAALTLTCGASLLTTACSPPYSDARPATADSTRTGNAQLKPEYDDKGRLQKIEYDRNSDGKVDAWGYMDGARVVRVEVDENGDGRIDRWEYHTSDAATPAAGGVDTTLERIERATKFDGKISRKEYFTRGVLSKIEEDTDGDGRIDKWETYADGSLSVLLLDTQKRGAPDRRLVYRTDGSLARMEADATGSGTFSQVTP